MTGCRSKIRSLSRNPAPKRKTNFRIVRMTTEGIRRGAQTTSPARKKVGINLKLPSSRAQQFPTPTIFFPVRASPFSS